MGERQKSVCSSDRQRRDVSSSETEKAVPDSV